MVANEIIGRSIEVIDLTDDSDSDWASNQFYQQPAKPKYVFASSLVKLAALQSATTGIDDDAPIVGESRDIGSTGSAVEKDDGQRPHRSAQSTNCRIKITKLPYEENDKTLYTCTVCPDDDNRETYDCIKECREHLRHKHADSGFGCFCVLCGELIASDELLLAHIKKFHEAK